MVLVKSNTSDRKDVLDIYWSTGCLISASYSLIPGQLLSAVGGWSEYEGTTRDCIVYRNTSVLSDHRLNLMWSL